MSSKNTGEANQQTHFVLSFWRLAWKARLGLAQKSSQQHSLHKKLDTIISYFQVLTTLSPAAYCRCRFLNREFAWKLHRTFFSVAASLPHCLHSFRFELWRSSIDLHDWNFVDLADFLNNYFSDFLVHRFLI